MISDEQVIADVRKVVGDPAYIATDPKKLCRMIFTTCYMGSVNSSAETKRNAKELAAQIGRRAILLRRGPKNEMMSLGGPQRFSQEKHSARFNIVLLYRIKNYRRLCR